MKTKTITVTQKDIDTLGGPPHTNCPVARAINRAFKKGVGFAKVSKTFIVLGKGHRYRRVDISHIPVYDFIGRYDTNQKVEPFSFTLRY